VSCKSYSCSCSTKKGLQHVLTLGLSAWASSLQLEGSQCLSRLKKGVQRYGSSTASGEARGDWGTRDKEDNGWQPTGTMCALPSPMAMVVTGGGYVLPRPGSIAPAPGTKKTTFFFFYTKGHHLWRPRSHAWPNCLFPICNFLSLPSCLPTCHACLP
jgi:hypothetical protein